MAKNLVIVESPAKAKTIEGYLGKDFIVKSSFGHVRDLPTKGDKVIDIDNDFTPTYVISPDKTKVISELKSLAKSSEEVWLATDDDREGESISWHLKEALGLKNTTKRIVFREITESAIKKAILNPREIDMDLVNAQQARRIMDRLIGFELSPVLWSKVQRGLSAGRVQSVAVRLIVEREKEIDNHKAISSFKAVALFDLPGNKVLKAELSKSFAKENATSSTIQSFDEASAMFLALESGQVDGVLQDYLINKERADKQGTSVVSIKFEDTPEQYGFAVETGNTALLEILNKGITDLKADGTYKTIYDKYFIG